MRKFILIIVLAFIAGCIYVAIAKPNDVDQNRCEITYSKEYKFVKSGTTKTCVSPQGDVKAL